MKFFIKQTTFLAELFFKVPKLSYCFFKVDFKNMDFMIKRSLNQRLDMRCAGNFMIMMSWVMQHACVPTQELWNAQEKT